MTYQTARFGDDLVQWFELSRGDSASTIIAAIPHAEFFRCGVAFLPMR